MNVEGIHGGLLDHLMVGCVVPASYMLRRHCQDGVEAVLPRAERPHRVHWTSDVHLGSQPVGIAGAGAVMATTHLRLDHSSFTMVNMLTIPSTSHD